MLSTYNDFYESPWGQFSMKLRPVNQVLGSLGSLASLYGGFKQMDLMEQQLALAEDYRNMAKAEADRIAGVRENLNASYTS
jgi:hypothetical protein